MKFIRVNKSIFTNLRKTEKKLNTGVELTGLDINVLSGILHLLSRRASFKDRVQKLTGIHTFRLYELTSFLYKHLKHATAKVRIVKTLKKLGEFGIIKIRQLGNQQVSFELNNEAINELMPMQENWFTLPTDLFEDPSKFSDHDLNNEELQRRFHGHEYALLTSMISFFIEGLISSCNEQKKQEPQPSSDDNDVAIKQWKILRQRLLNGIGCALEDLSPQEKNTISHRFYRALRRLKELGFINFTEIMMSKGKRILALSNLILNSALRALLTEINRKRINAYKAAIQRNQFSNKKPKVNSGVTNFQAEVIKNNFQAKKTRDLIQVWDQP